MENHKPEKIKVGMHQEQLRGTAIMLILLAFSLLIGMAGFHWVAKLDWTDSFLNASMLLTGMGPVDEPEDKAGKIFAGIYALYSGIVFLSAIAIFIYPFVEHAGKHLAGKIDDKKADDCD
ncbi:MAG: hypothetical protein K2U26_09930 [Cyclobacteriaceae bacterium]|nr:hypothetical protein [Cyclobacteriaceae bacterium]